MIEHDLDQRKNELIEQVSACFSAGTIDTQLYEQYMKDISHGHSHHDLAVLAASLPQGCAGTKNSSGKEMPVINCQLGKIKKQGLWVEDKNYRVTSQAGKVRLDLRDYHQTDNFYMELFLDLQASELRLDVPTGFTVSNKLETAQESRIKNEPRKSPWGNNHITIRGQIKDSQLQVNYY